MASRNQTNHYRAYPPSSSVNSFLPGPGRAAPPTIVEAPAVPGSLRGHYPYPPDTIYNYSPVSAPAPPPTVDVDHLVLRVVDSIGPSLKAIHDLNQRVGNTQAAAMEALSKQQTEMRTEFDEKYKKLNFIVDNLKNIQAATLKSLAVFSENMGEAVGIGSKPSLFSRVEEVRLNVGEMYEKSKDPHANVDVKGPDIIVVDTPEPEPKTKTAPLLRRSNTVMVGTTPPPLESVATSPLRIQFMSRATSPRTPSTQREFVSVEVNTSLPHHVEKGVDPINTKYTEAAVDATPMDNEDVDSRFSRGYNILPLETSTQIADDGASVVRPSAELGETVDAPVNVDDYPALEYIDDPTSVMSQTDTHGDDQESHFARRLCKINSDLLHMEQSSFSPVNWSNEDPGGSSTGGVSKKQISVFHPDASPEVAKSFSVLKDQDQPLDGTVASLRRDALGDSFAGPLTATPTTMLPYYSRPSVSPPLPSPASSRSPSPTMNVSIPALDPERTSSRQPSVDLPTAVETSVGSPLPLAFSPATPAISPRFPDSSPRVSPPPLVLSPTLNEEELVSSTLVPSVHGSPVASVSEDHFLEQDSTREDLPEASETLAESSIQPLARVSNDPSYPVMLESVTANVGSTVYFTPDQKDRGSSPITISSTSPSPGPVKQKMEHFPQEDDVPIISATKMAGKKSKAPDAPRLNLTVRDGGKAATRVRKRKENTKEEEEEPPLKRARQRRSPEKRKIISTPKRRKEDVKEKGDKSGNSLSSKKGKQKKSSMVPVKWPKIKPSNDDALDRKFIKCDMCLVWYHYGCVGIRSLNDNRLKSSFTYVCPPCDVGNTNTHPVQTSQGSCSRPDCTLGTTNENEFYVAGVIGRKTKVEGGYGRKYLWLLKWEGYPVRDSTWESEESMADPQTLIEGFEEAAVKEGLNPNDDPHCTILLQEAKDAGLKSDEDAD